MKMKTLSIVTLATLLTGSVAFADSTDMSTPDNSAVSGSVQQAAPAPDTAVNTAQNTVASNNATDSMNTTSDSSNNDDMSADTATGDDDY